MVDTVERGWVRGKVGWKEGKEGTICDGVCVWSDFRYAFVEKAKVGGILRKK